VCSGLTARTNLLDPFSEGNSTIEMETLNSKCEFVKRVQPKANFEENDAPKIALA